MTACDNLWRRLCMSDFGADSEAIYKAAVQAMEDPSIMKQVYRKMLSFELQLRFTQGPRAGTVIRVKMGQTTGIGRSRQNDICILQDEMVSRKHAQLYVKETKNPRAKFFIRDLGSINGTFINQQQLEKDEATPVTLNDQVEMGNSIFNVEVYVPSEHDDDKETESQEDPQPEANEAMDPAGDDQQ